MSAFKLRNPFRAERLGGFIPFVWYGSRWRTWSRILRSGGYDITLNRLPNVLGVTAMTPIAFLVDKMTDALFDAKAEKTQVIPPVFVLGHWRSGTTFLHNLLASDPAHAFPTTFQCTFTGGFPLIEGSTSWLFGFFLPSTRPMDKVPLSRDGPFEDEFALIKRDAGSPYLDLAFPSHGPKHTRFLDFEGTTEAERRKWEETMVWLMRRFQLVNPGKRLVLKSPPHTARIATLLKLFPDARFIHISRNPFEIYPSTMKLWRVINSRFGLQNPANDRPWLPEYILSTLPRMYAAYERDVAMIPKGRLVEITYEHLARDPLGAVQAAYGALDIGDFAAAKPHLEAYLSSLDAHEPSPADLTAAERAAIVERWGCYFDRFGYSRTGS